MMKTVMIVYLALNIIGITWDWFNRKSTRRLQIQQIMKEATLISKQQKVIALGVVILIGVLLDIWIWAPAKGILMTMEAEQAE